MNVNSWITFDIFYSKSDTDGPVLHFFSNHKCVVLVRGYLDVNIFHRRYITEKRLTTTALEDQKVSVHVLNNSGYWLKSRTITDQCRSGNFQFITGPGTHVLSCFIILNGALLALHEEHFSVKWGPRACKSVHLVSWNWGTVCYVSLGHGACLEPHAASPTRGQAEVLPALLLFLFYFTPAWFGAFIFCL